jgi:hypothetical protein
MQRVKYVPFFLGLSPESAFFGGMLYGFGVKRAKAAMTVVNDSKEPKPKSYIKQLHGLLGGKAGSLKNL